MAANLNQKSQIPCDILGEALRYGSLGWRVLPVNGKVPAIKKWPEIASSDSHTIRSWFSRENNARNIGIATGEMSGIVVLDVDPRNGGDLTLKRLEAELGKLPSTAKAITGGGGFHLIFCWFEGAKSTSVDGVDFLSDGKMFVAAPSIHPHTGIAYVWAIDPAQCRPAHLPESWRNYFSSGLKRVGREPSDRIVQGERNNRLVSLAGSLRQAGESPAVIQGRLLESNAINCAPPLPHNEVMKIAASVLRYPVAKGKSFKTQWQDAVFHSSLPTVAKAALIAISMHADENGKSCWPTQKTIASMASCTDRSIRDHLNLAEKDGWIRRYTKPRSEGRGFSYGYVLTLFSEPERRSALDLRPENYDE